jgi:hypothetical protein
MTAIRLLDQSQIERAGTAEGFTTCVVWGTFLVVASLAGSIVFACVTPFAAFAAVAAMTLRMRAALITVTGIWLANQAVGYGMLHYPITHNSLAWGIALGLSALAATIAARAILSRVPDRGGLLCYAAGLGAALLVQQSALVVASGFLGGSENFSLEIFSGVAALSVLWTAGLAASHHRLGSMARHGRLARPVM